MNTSTKARGVDAALLLLRIGFGLCMLLFHGWGKISGGPETWARVGGAMSAFGIDFWPTFWGFCAAITESAGSILIMLGILFRPAAGLLAFTMAIAAARHLGLPADSPGAGWSGASHAIEYLVVWVALAITGPGRHSLPLPRALQWLR